MSGLGPQKRRDLAKALRANGFYEDTKQGKGSHTYWRHPDKPALRAAMPGKGNGEIVKGTAHSILRATGKTVEHYFDSIK